MVGGHTHTLTHTHNTRQISMQFLPSKICSLDIVWSVAKVEDSCLFNCVVRLNPKLVGCKMSFLATQLCMCLCLCWTKKKYPKCQNPIIFFSYEFLDYSMMTCTVNTSPDFAPSFVIYLTIVETTRLQVFEFGLKTEVSVLQPVIEVRKRDLGMALTFLSACVTRVCATRDGPTICRPRTH